MGSACAWHLQGRTMDPLRRYLNFFVVMLLPVLLPADTTAFHQGVACESAVRFSAFRIHLLRSHLRLRREGESPAPVNRGITSENIARSEGMRANGADLRLRGGGMFKKLKKGLALNSAEKEWIEKAMKGGVEKAVSGKKSRRELASLHRRRKPPAISSTQHLRIANRISQKAQMEIAKRLANHADMAVSVQSVQRGGSRRPPRLKDAREEAEEWMGGDEATEGGTRMIDDDGDIDEKTMEGLGEGKKGRGWKFDEAVRTKAGGERAFLAKLRKERAEEASESR